MSRYIDADELKVSYIAISTTTNSLCHLYVSVEDINSAPSIEIVRCKDCKWFGEIGCAIKIADDSDKPKEDDFCSFAERREE